MRKTSLLAALLILPLASGCVAVAGLTVGAGVVGYVFYDKNEARQDFDSGFEKTWKATLTALRGLEYALPKDPTHASDSGELVLDKLHVHVASHPGNKTRVSVRVGTFDTEEHRRRAGLILERIESEL